VGLLCLRLAERRAHHQRCGDPAGTTQRGIGDFNRDPRSDILFQNDTGEVVIRELNGGGNSVLSSRLDELAGRDHRSVAENRDQVTLPRALTRSTQNPFSVL
jgi:hypothetical protein